MRCRNTLRQSCTNVQAKVYKCASESLQMCKRVPNGAGRGLGLGLGEVLGLGCRLGGAGPATAGGGENGGLRACIL